jgi:hypothetical protein
MFTLIIRSAIISLCKQFNVAIVVKMFKNIRARLRDIQNSSAIVLVSPSGIKHYLDFGGAKLCQKKPGEICQPTTQMFQGVKMVGGRVVRELIKTDMSSSGIKNIRLATTTGMPESTDLLLRNQSGDILDPMRLFTTKTGINKTIN